MSTAEPTDASAVDPETFEVGGPDITNTRLARLVVAGALVALTAAAPAYAQIMVPMQPPRERVDVYSDVAKADPGDNPANWSAQQNVVESRRYEQLVRTNPAFRAARIRKECGSITEPGLYQQCVASFDN